MTSSASADAQAPGPPARVNWASVATFYAVACGLSWPLFWWRDIHRESWLAWAAPGYVKGLLPAAGPCLAAALCLVLFRRTHPRTVTLLGTDAARSAAFIAAPVVLLTILGTGDDEPHLTGLYFGAVFAAYGFGEEMGWRGFLQDAARPLDSPLRRSLLVGALWGAWHFTTFLGGEPAEVAVRVALLAALWVAGSWGIGVAVDRTGSVLVAASLHLGFNYATALPRETWFPLLAASALVWYALLRTWPARPLTPSAASSALPPPAPPPLGPPPAATPAPPR